MILSALRSLTLLRALFLTFLLGMAWTNARGIANGSSTPPTSAQIPNWDAGWGNASVTGWDYVGQLNDGGGVYLGNNWVLTAGHVGGGTFTLDGVAYQMVPNSAVSISSTLGTADLTLFQLASGPDLPPLIIANSPPVPFSQWQSGDSVVMLGFGGGGGHLTWGLDTVTNANVDYMVDGYSYVNSGFVTAYGTTTIGNNSVTNNAYFISGDSGGADFIYNSFTGQWELAGINDAVDTSNHDSYIVQLSTYSSQFRQIAAVPEPNTLLLTLLALPLLLRLRRVKSAASDKA